VISSHFVLFDELGHALIHIYEPEGQAGWSVDNLRSRRHEPGKVVVLVPTALITP
jgi:hypothetical protein